MRRLVGCALALALLAAGTALAGPSDEEKIEALIEAVVEAYRTGDYAAMGQYYAPDVTVVPGDYNPPVEGWDQVQARYQQAYNALGPVEMIRENTRIERRKNFAWAVYQWRFGAVRGKESVVAWGHTTLVLEKRRGRWLIVHNHTSALVPPRAPETPSPADPSR